MAAAVTGLAGTAAVAMAAVAMVALAGSWPDNCSYFDEMVRLPHRKRNSQSMLLYAATIFAGAFLLFQVEPLLARYILPWFGGTSAVWITCMLFFQLLLVAGYAYSHLIATRLSPRRQVIVHLVVVCACVMLMGALTLVWQSPITPGPNWKPLSPDFPIARIFGLLLVSIGLPFFILSTNGPLLQAWFARSHQGAAPYRLYALSNVGSLLALVTYPFLVEPALTLKAQAIAWSLLFVAFAVGVALCGLDLAKSADSADHSLDEDLSAEELQLAAPTRATYTLWIALAAVASLMLLATTNEICQEVAVVPFLWILPLAIYLLSFIVCFDSDRWYQRGIFHPALGLAIFLACIILCRSTANIFSQVLVYCALLAAVCMVCHGELVKLKPAERHLTSFYLMIAVGGAVGGILAAVVAPKVFTGYWEFHFAIWASALMLFIVVMRDRQSWIHESRPITAMVLVAGALLLPQLMGDESIADAMRHLGNWHLIVTILVALGLLALAAFRKQSKLIGKRPGLIVQAGVIAGLVVVGGVLLVSIAANLVTSSLTTRNFYGALSVYSLDTDNPEKHSFKLRHGRIVHGIQYTAPDKVRLPVSYYSFDSGLGLLMSHLPGRSGPDPHDRPIRMGAIGLGIGTVAAYGQTGDYIRFYEINPEVTKIATDPNGFFTYLRDTLAKVEIIPGDARLSMEREVANDNSQRFDVLILDAFAGDGIPVHLLTREAVEIYLRELKRDGVLAIHVTNRYLDLRPVVHELVERFNLHSGWKHSPGGPISQPSDWILAARSDEVLGQPEVASQLQSLDSQPKVRLWTDDYSNLFQILR